MDKQKPVSPLPQAPDPNDVKLLIRYKILTGMYRRLNGPAFWGATALRQEYERLRGLYRDSICGRPPADK